MEKSSGQLILKKSEEPTKFLFVGITGVFVNFFVLFISTEFFKLPPWIALVIAIYVSMTSNYILNRIWTFKSNKAILLEYGKYLITNLLGGLIQYFSTLFIFSLLGEDDLSIVGQFDFPTLYFATGIGIGLGFVSNFLFSKFIVFADNGDA